MKSEQKERKESVCSGAAMGGRLRGGGVDYSVIGGRRVHRTHYYQRRGRELPSALVLFLIYIL